MKGRRNAVDKSKAAQPKAGPFSLILIPADDRLIS
jgi:hypothetical protein